MKQLLILLISLLSINLAIGQESEKQIIDKFFELYETNPIKALDYIYDTNNWVDKNGDAVKQLKSQLKQIQELVGEYHGKEFLHKAKLTDSFITYIYFAKYERQPLRFTFQFYKPKDKWVLYAFMFDDTFNKDFQEVIKYEYMRSPY